METTTTHHDPTSITDPPAHPHLDLYTIPSYSSWFCWDEIHETERIGLKEFFHGTSISRTPKIYKEYRDFIINKYREEPSRRLRFTEVRKSLVGDVSLLHKVFLFLEKWGLINFGAPSGGDSFVVEEGKEVSKVVIEEGAPNGIRVVAVPNSLKPISVPSVGGNRREAVESVSKLPPLASYSDVFGDLKQKGLVCGNCGEYCNSGHYESSKDKFIICIKCFKNEYFGENKSKDEFEFSDPNGSSGNQGAVWTEADILLLLESVLKHGDDWELVAQNVQNKNKLDCISKLLEMPFGELIFGSSHGKDDGPNENTNNTKQVQHSSSQHQGITNTEDPCCEQTIEGEKDGDAVSQDPPTKRIRISSLSDAGGSLMKQVAHFSTMVGPHITAAAADAAVTAICSENSFSREIFDGETDDTTNVSSSPTPTCKLERAHQVKEDSDVQENLTQLETQEASPKNDIPLTLRIRAAIATALGAAAVHAKLLADQEDKEIEHLVATIIETQLKKLHCKIKHFEDLELIMKKEYDEMEELKEHIVSERINVLQRVFSAGISRWRDHTSLKSQNGNVF